MSRHGEVKVENGELTLAIIRIEPEGIHSKDISVCHIRVESPKKGITLYLSREQARFLARGIFALFPEEPEG